MYMGLAHGERPTQRNPGIVLGPRKPDRLKFYHFDAALPLCSTMSTLALVANAWLDSSTEKIRSKPVPWEVSIFQCSASLSSR